MIPNFLETTGLGIDDVLAFRHGRAQSLPLLAQHVDLPPELDAAPDQYRQRHHQRERVIDAQTDRLEDVRTHVDRLGELLNRPLPGIPD